MNPLIQESTDIAWSVGAQEDRAPNRRPNDLSEAFRYSPPAGWRVRKINDSGQAAYQLLDAQRNSALAFFSIFFPVTFLMALFLVVVGVIGKQFML